jgi:anti-anti-sigma factor
VFEVERIDTEGEVRILVRGELDLDSGARVQDALERAERDRPPLVVLDLTQVTFFDSTGLQTVLDADVRARDDGRRFVLAPGDGEPLRVLRLAEVIDRLTLEDPAG